MDLQWRVVGSPLNPILVDLDAPHPATIGDSRRARVFRRDNMTCQYCGRPGDTIDHIIPRARHGSELIGNLTVACRECNKRKGDLLPAECDMWPANGLKGIQGRPRVVKARIPPRTAHRPRQRDYIGSTPPPCPCDACLRRSAELHPAHVPTHPWQPPRPYWR